VKNETKFSPHSKDSYNLIGLKEAAQKLRIAPLMLYGWCQMKKIPYFKIGRYLRFDENDLDRFISQQRIEQISY